HYRRKLIDGEFSILGVRDDIALSEEAQETLAELTLQERRGRACLWQGLEDALAFIVPPPLAREGVVLDAPPSLRSAFEEILVPSEVHSILAYNAVGETADVGAYGLWAKTYQDPVAAMERRVSRSLELRRQQTPRSKRYRLDNLLAAMKLGATATRLTDGAVKARAGAAGVIVFGPYMPLEPGQHSAIFSLRTESSDALCLRLEVVHGDILFAHRELRLQGPSQENYRLEFTVPSGSQELLRKPNFEFRLSTDGGGAVICEAVMLEVGEDADVAKTAHPSVANWFALLTTEVSGKRCEDGTLLALPSSGRVFFGPYCKLLPGRYALTFEYRSESNGEVELEVGAGTDSILAR
ncbi:MAG: hypothetical protein P4L92_13555, partial [Rudaea sp.]|nr:hypothetical protein [Rudaea sp.]